MKRILFSALLLAGMVFAQDSYTFHCSTSINGKHDNKYKDIRRLRVKRCERYPHMRTKLVVQNANIDCLVVHANCKVKLERSTVSKIHFIHKDGFRRAKVVICDPKTHNVEHFDGKGILVRKYI